MEKALTAILSSTSCNDLLRFLEETLQETMLGKILSTRVDFDELLELVFHEYRHEDRGKQPAHALPDYVYVSLAILSIALGDIYIHRFALRFSRMFQFDVLASIDDESLVRIGYGLGVRLEYSREKCFKEVMKNVGRNNVVATICYRFRIPIIDYLRIARKLLTEIPWKLSSFPISKGYVYIDQKEKIARLLAEHMYNIVSSKLKNIRAECENTEAVKSKMLGILKEFGIPLADAVEDFMNSLKIQPPPSATKRIDVENISIKMLKEVSSISSVEDLVALAQNLFPPCIRELIDTLMRGENLSHHQRFALATFLINIGVDTELVVKLFSYSPDFNEKVARYQVEHLAGLKGSKKKYLVYSCNTMKTLGMCKSDCGIKNPLLYPRKIATKKRNQKS